MRARMAAFILSSVFVGTGLLLPRSGWAQQGSGDPDIIGVAECRLSQYSIPDCMCILKDLQGDVHHRDHWEFQLVLAGSPTTEHHTVELRITGDDAIRIDSVDGDRFKIFTEVACPASAPLRGIMVAKEDGTPEIVVLLDGVPVLTQDVYVTEYSPWIAFGYNRSVTSPPPPSSGAARVAGGGTTLDFFKTSSEMSADAASDRTPATVGATSVVASVVVYVLHGVLASPSLCPDVVLVPATLTYTQTSHCNARWVGPASTGGSLYQVRLTLNAAGFPGTGSSWRPVIGVHGRDSADINGVDGLPPNTSVQKLAFFTPNVVEIHSGTYQAGSFLSTGNGRLELKFKSDGVGFGVLPECPE